MRSLLFLLQTYGEVDHIAPLIWKCLERGQRALVVVTHGLQYSNDHRFAFLARYPRFEVLDLWGVRSGSRVARLAARVLWTKARVGTLLEQHQVSACVVGWGWGVGIPGRRPSRSERERDRMSWAHVPRRSDVVRLAARGLPSLRMSILLAAQERGIPSFGLPHGVGLRLMNPERHRTLELMRRYHGDFAGDGRNQFAAYVVASALDQEHAIRYCDFAPAIAQAWGSLRFCPQWIRVLDDVFGDVPLPMKAEGRVSVLYLAPKPGRSDREAARALLLSLAARGDIQLVVKSHPRKALDEQIAGQLHNRPTVWLAGGTPSSALIRRADVTIAAESSVTIEVLTRGKHLIHVSYLGKPQVYEEYGGCLIARRGEDVHRFLDLLVRGTPLQIDEHARDRVLSLLVYAGREPFDVPEYYYEQIQRYFGGRSSST